MVTDTEGLLSCDRRTSMRKARTFQALVPVVLGVALGGIGLPVGAADEPKPAPTGTSPAGTADRNEDWQAIRATADRFTRAFNEGDAKAIAALFTEDGEVIDEDGNAVRGRSAIADHFASALVGSPGGKIEMTIDSLRFLTAEVAQEEGYAVVTSVGERPEISRYTALHVKRDGKWFQASVREHPEKFISPHERLKELEWMVGEWVDEDDEAVVFTTCRWSDDKNFLLRDFTVQVQGRPAMSGTQRIGWDPHTRQFKSWVFDSEGGFGEGLWSRNGNQWIVKATGVLQDGRTASATQIITFVSKDMARWKTTDRTVGGRALPDVRELVIVRKPPKPM
jgi:uncharacterized protein (TIGR02246 family)